MRDALAIGTARFGLTDPRKCASRRLTIVTFHRVLQEAQRRIYPFPGLAVTPEELFWFMNYFTKYYECGPLTYMVERWLAGGPDDSPLLAVTFDDGPLDNYRNARPVLDHFKVRASFYVPAALIDQAALVWHDRLGFAVSRLLEQPGGSEKLGKTLGLTMSLVEREILTQVVRTAKHLPPSQRDCWVRAIESLVDNEKVPEWASMMNWNHLNSLAGDGHEIGSHSMTHPILCQCNDKELEHEIADSRATIEERLGTKIVSFCYPNGTFDERVVAAVRKAGYNNAVTTTFGLNRPGKSIYQLRRCDMHPGHSRSRHGKLSESRLALRLSGLQPGLST